MRSCFCFVFNEIFFYFFPQKIPRVSPNEPNPHMGTGQKESEPCQASEVQKPGQPASRPCQASIEELEPCYQPGSEPCQAGDEQKPCQPESKPCQPESKPC